MSTRARIETEYSGKKTVVAYETESLDNVGRLAIVLIEKWGLVAATPDGEDTAGRAKALLPSNSELVERALDIAALFYAEARTRGHVVTLPDLNEINEGLDKKGEAREESRRS